MSYEDELDLDGRSIYSTSWGGKRWYIILLTMTIRPLWGPPEDEERYMLFIEDGTPAGHEVLGCFGDKEGALAYIEAAKERIEAGQDYHIPMW